MKQILMSEIHTIFNKNYYQWLIMASFDVAHKHQIDLDNKKEWEDMFNFDIEKYGYKDRRAMIEFTHEGIAIIIFGKSGSRVNSYDLTLEFIAIFTDNKYMHYR